MGDRESPRARAPPCGADRESEKLPPTAALPSAQNYRRGRSGPEGNVSDRQNQSTAVAAFSCASRVVLRSVHHATGRDPEKCAEGGKDEADNCSGSGDPGLEGAPVGTRGPLRDWAVPGLPYQARPLMAYARHPRGINLSQLRPAGPCETGRALASGRSGRAHARCGPFGPRAGAGHSAREHRGGPTAGRT